MAPGKSKASLSKAEAKSEDPADLLADWCPEVRDAFLRNMDILPEVKLGKKKVADSIEEIALPGFRIMRMNRLSPEESMVPFEQMKKDLFKELETSMGFKAFVAASNIAIFKHYFPKLEKYNHDFQAHEVLMFVVALQNMPYLASKCPEDNSKVTLATFLAAVVEAAAEQKAAEDEENLLHMMALAWKGNSVKAFDYIIACVEKYEEEYSEFAQFADPFLCLLENYDPMAFTFIAHKLSAMGIMTGGLKDKKDLFRRFRGEILPTLIRQKCTREPPETKFEKSFHIHYQNRIKAAGFKDEFWHVDKYPDTETIEGTSSSSQPVSKPESKSNAVEQGNTEESKIKEEAVIKEKGESKSKKEAVPKGNGESKSEKEVVAKENEDSQNKKKEIKTEAKSDKNVDASKQVEEEVDEAKVDGKSTDKAEDGESVIGKTVKNYILGTGNDDSETSKPGSSSHDQHFASSLPEAFLMEKDSDKANNENTESAHSKISNKVKNEISESGSQAVSGTDHEENDPQTAVNHNSNLGSKNSGVEQPEKEIEQVSVQNSATEPVEETSGEHGMKNETPETEASKQTASKQTASKQTNLITPETARKQSDEVAAKSALSPKQGTSKIVRRAEKPTRTEMGKNSKSTPKQTAKKEPKQVQPAEELLAQRLAMLLSKHPELCPNCLGEHDLKACPNLNKDSRDNMAAYIVPDYEDQTNHRRFPFLTKCARRTQQSASELAAADTQEDADN